MEQFLLCGRLVDCRSTGELQSWEYAERLFNESDLQWLNQALPELAIKTRLRQSPKRYNVDLCLCSLIFDD